MNKVIGFVMIGTNNLEKSSKFYDTILNHLGLKRISITDRYIGYGHSSDDDQVKFYITKPYNNENSTAVNGNMIALTAETKEAVDKLYSLLLADNYDILLDDRGLRPGVMFSEAELLGIPHRITISEKTLIDGKFEYKNRSSSEASLIESNELMNLLKID